MLMQHATTWIILVKKLQQQLQEETDLHVALASAVEHSGSPSSDFSGKLPDEVSLPVRGFSSFIMFFSQYLWTSGPGAFR
ncbi:uncharacterized protein LOC111303020 [Durio zibethinus]|uniref:Uncharacterized protein LOC111303020 n=1 Tax=Durio zibethinus TaxID=66656 RepID=A0A6P5ZQS6_DURZI|nr:uncharacterized protein LOC111303020 [Durio zibethinus]